MKSALTKQQAIALWEESLGNPSRLYKIADEIRRDAFGNRVELCSIINAKSGNCREDCRFCAQSAHHKTNIKPYPLVSSEKMFECSKEAAKNKAHGFGIVTSGDSIDEEKELTVICDAVRQIKKQGAINPDASLGRLTDGMAKRLKDAGLARYHHNLETSERFFPNICATHSYKDRIKTIEAAKRAGFEVCCGGLFGLGETIEDRIALAFELKALGVDSVPLNFLIPIKGTPLEDIKPLSGDEILMTIAIFRLILQDKHIKACGGREFHLRERQPEIFSAGADGIMVGGYLTQGGNPVEDDLRMLREAGLECSVGGGR